MPVDAMFGKTINLLAKSVELRAKNHNLIAGNLANAETPGYVPFGLAFEQELKQAAEGKKSNGVSTTHPRHIPLKGEASTLDAVNGKVVATPASSVGEDGNMVEVEGEASRMTQNQLMFNATIQILGKKFEGIKTAIKEVYKWDFFSAMDISASALTAERTRMNLISSNLANANSTKTAEGGPYKRKDALFTAVPVQNGFSNRLADAVKQNSRGVLVTQVVEDQNPPRMQYDPTHPDADAQGYVTLPNVNVVEEMADMIAATRAYEANVNATQAAKAMATKTLELLR